MIEKQILSAIILFLIIAIMTLIYKYFKVECELRDLRKNKK